VLQSGRLRTFPEPAASILPCMAAQPRRIVVGFDGSDAAWRALDVAAGLTGYGSTLAVVSVEP